MFLSAMSWARKTHKEFEIAVQLNPANFEAQRDLIRYEMNAPGIVGGGDDKALKHIEELEKIDAWKGQLARGEFLATKREMTRGGCGLRKDSGIEHRPDRSLLRGGRLLPRPPKSPKKWARRLPPPNESIPNDRRLEILPRAFSWCWKGRIRPRRNCC